MSKIDRFDGNYKAFASEQQTNERTTFGTETISDDLTAQQTPEYLRGMGIVGPSQFPTLQDFNAVNYAISQALAYMHQMGAPEWNAAQEYPTEGATCLHNGVQWYRKSTWTIGDEPGVSDSWRSNIVTLSSVYDPLFAGLKEGQRVELNEYHPDSNLGGDHGKIQTARHNGGTAISVDRARPVDWSDSAQVDAWFEDSGVDELCFVRNNADQGVICAEWFGALGDVDIRDIPNSFDSTKSFKAAERACLAEIPRSSTPADNEVYWDGALTFGRGLFKITKPLIKDTLADATESVTFRGVGRMSRLLWSPSKVVANNRAQDGLFDLDLTRYGSFTNFSVLGDFSSPGHGFDMGEASKFTIKDVSLYLTAGALDDHPENGELKLTQLHDIVYGFRYNKSTGNSILNDFDNVRVGDAASLNNGSYAAGAQGVVGWGVDEALAGGPITINSTKWVKCKAESILSATRLIDTDAIACNMDILAEGMFNEYTVFPALLGTPAPTADLSGNTLTSDVTLPAYIYEGHFVIITSQSSFDGQARRITDVTGNVITVDGDFDFNDTNVTFSVVQMPVMTLEGFSSSPITGYVESSIASSPSYNLSLFNMYMRSCKGNDVLGFFDAFNATFNSPRNKFKGSFNGLYLSGLNDIDGGYNNVSGVVTNSSTWSKSGVLSSENMITNNVESVVNATNSKLVGRLSATAIPANDFSYDVHVGTSNTAATTQIPIYITENWTDGNNPLIGVFELEATYWTSADELNGKLFATFSCTKDGVVTILDSFSPTGSVSFSAGSTYFQIENTNGDKKFSYSVKRIYANTSVYGI